LSFIPCSLPSLAIPTTAIQRLVSEILASSITNVVASIEEVFIISDESSQESEIQLNFS